MINFTKIEHSNIKTAFPYKESLSKDYRVFLNGLEISVYNCRVSAMPFNIWWQGHQRDICQSELASFINFESDEEIKVEVIANRDFKNVMLKPYSRKVKTVTEKNKITFTLISDGQYVLELDNAHFCLHIFYNKIENYEGKEKATYYFGEGVHFAGKITLKNNESVYIDKNALVYGNIFARNAENIRIFGHGILDDGTEERVCEQCYEDYTNGNMKFYDCKNIKIEGVILRNSAIWCLNLFHCFDVVINGIKIIGQWRYNTDGIDIINSQNINIKNSFVRTFDDAITIKGIDLYADTDCKNIHIENCVLWCDWGRTCEIGLETACKEYKDISFKNCDLLHNSGVAMDIQNGDYAEVSNIFFENINVEYNSFDNVCMLQNSEEQKYDGYGKIHIPVLFGIANERFREMDCYKQLFNGAIQVKNKLSSSVHDVYVKNINVFYDNNILLYDGKFYVPINIKSSVKGVKYFNITIENLVINGQRINEKTAVLNISDVENFKLI